jgi:cytochrome c-type biogenesis protein CcmH
MPKRLILTAQIAFLLIASLTMLGAGDPATRYDKLGHKMMCICGCNEILLECNHVGCTDSTRMTTELRSHLDAGLSDSAILSWFADKYGNIALAAPMRGNLFDKVAWIAPFAVLFIGLIAIILLLILWRRRHAQLPTPACAPPTASDDDLRNRIRRDTTYGD